MQYKRLCNILDSKGFKYQVSKNKITFKVGKVIFKIVYRQSTCSDKWYYDMFNNYFIPSKTYMNYREIKSVLLNNF